MKDLTRSNSICPPPETVLLESVTRNDEDTIKTLVTSNPSLLSYEYPNTSKTILLTACSEQGVAASTIQILIDLGADVKGNYEWKPLHLAAQNPNSSVLEVIIKNLNPGSINDTENGNTALHSLIKSNEIKRNEDGFCRHVELLLIAGINVNQGDSKNLSVIFWAAKHGYKQIIRTILEKSVSHVDLDSHTLRGKTARDLILEKNLYTKPLPEPILYQSPEDKLFCLIKSAKEEEFLECLVKLSSTNPEKFLNIDDGNCTLLQYSCEKGLTKVVKYLLDNGANVNLVTKNQEKKPVELVIENGFYEILDLMIKHSEIEISSKMFCYLIKHSDNPKFDKINHEECCQIVLTKLQTNKSIIDINGEDEMKNTVIHYSLRYSDETTTQKILNLGASLACKNSFGIMPIEDIKPEMLEQHLDDCIKFDIKNKNDEKRDFEVIFDYQTLIPPKKGKKPKSEESDVENCSSFNDGLVPETEVIAYMSKTPDLKSLLKHPVIVSFLFMKWHRIRFIFYTNLIFYILFVASLLCYIFSYYANFDTEKPSTFCMVITNLSWIMLNLTFFILVLRELFQITISPSKYFRNFENLVEVILIIITGMILYTKSPTHDARKQLSSIAILLASFELVLMVGQHPKLSTNVVMLKTVSINFFKLLLWYSLLIIAFALSFSILFAKTEFSENVNCTNSEDEDQSDDLFMSPGKSIFKTIVMLTGEFDASSINFHSYPITSKLIFSLFVFMITIILLNLLNGLAVSDTQAIKNDAELVGHIARAQHIHYVESMLLGNILPSTLINAVQNLFCCFPCDKSKTYNFFKPLAKQVCLFSSQNCQLIVLPNNYGKIFYEFDFRSKRQSGFLMSCSRNCADMYLDKETVKRINSIVKIKRELEEGSSNQVQNLHAEIAALKVKLDEILSVIKNNKCEFLITNR